MQPTVESLQGELLALRCHIAALIEVLPLNSLIRYRSKLDSRAALIGENLRGEQKSGFDRELIALRSVRSNAL